MISIRARTDGGQIRDRIVDESENEDEFAPATTDTPLSLAELIHLIDTVNRTLSSAGGGSPPGAADFRFLSRTSGLPGGRRDGPAFTLGVIGGRTEVKDIGVVERKRLRGGIIFASG